MDPAYGTSPFVEWFIFACFDGAKRIVMKRIAARGIPQNAPRVMKKTLWSAESACNAVQNVQLVLLATEGHPREDTIERLRVLASQCLVAREMLQLDLPEIAELQPHP